MNILATLVVYLVSVQGGEDLNVRIVLEPKIEASSCVEMVEDLIEMNQPMFATIVEPGFTQETIKFHPKNLQCEPYRSDVDVKETF